MKKCSRCGVVHERKHPYCSDCQREYNRAWRARNPEKARAWNMDWKRRHRDRVRELSRKSDRKRYWENPELMRARKLAQYYKEKAKWLARSASRAPEKKRATWRVKWRIEQGRMVRPQECQKCGGPGPIEAHHPDYSQPEWVEWLCTRCHGSTRRKEGTIS